MDLVWLKVLRNSCTDPDLLYFVFKSLQKSIEPIEARNIETEEGRTQTQRPTLVLSF